MKLAASNRIYDEYRRVIQELSEKSGGRSKAGVGALLSSIICEQLASHLIFHLDSDLNEDIRFDSYYGEKHEMAKRKLIDRLKTELSSAGRDHQFLLCSEEASDLGRPDLTIVNDSRLKIQTGNGKKLVVEVKASLGLDLAQIERHLLNGEPLLLIRIMTGQVKLLRPENLSSFLEESMKDLVSKAGRIMNSRPFLVSGYECYRCPLSKCDHNKSKVKERRIISMNQKEFGEDVETFMVNLYPTIERATQIILRELELEAPSPSPTEVRP